MSKKIKKPTIDEMNMVIAQFMGGRDNKKGEWRGIKCIPKTSRAPIFGDGYYLPEYLDYHASMDWIMPVVEKIEKKTGVMTIGKNRCGLKGDLPYYHGKTTLEAIHKSVYYTIVSESFNKMINKRMSNKEWIMEVEKISPTNNK